MDVDFTVVDRNYIWTEIEDQIFVGDVIGFSENKIEEEKEDVIVIKHIVKRQPFLMTGILLQIIDKQHIKVITEIGEIVILDLNYFNNLKLIHSQKDSITLYYYLNLCDTMQQYFASKNKYIYRINLLCDVNKEFKIKYEIEKENTCKKIENLIVSSSKTKKYKKT
jgi:hypothetical protein